MLVPGQNIFWAQEKPPQEKPPTPAATTEPKATPDQLDALVAPIALYPDPLLAQTLVASTYPLEIVQLHQWLAKNKQLKDKALADEVGKQPWDTSIQSMAAVPDVVKRLADDIEWTTELGNAFLAQQSDVMDAVQRMRAKAKSKGALESNQQQKVETKVVEEKTVIVVESSDPEVIYVPTYSPTVVYGPPVYPYPPIYYPPYTPGAAFVTFGFGMAMGAAIWGGSCCGCGWGGNNVNVNVNNNFNRNTQVSGSRTSNTWQHNSSHRGAAPYSNKATADRYGGSTRGQSAGGTRAASTQQLGGAAGASRGASAGVSQSGGGTRGSAAGASSMDRGGSGASTRSASGGGNQMGSRDVPKSSASSGGGFGGGSSGFSGSSARASSSRGSASMGSRGGGGGRRR